MFSPRLLAFLEIDAARVHIEEDGRVSKMLDSTSQVSGSVWHMVDEFWLKRWRKFVLGRAARRYEPPGPITNEHLLESVARTRYLLEEGMTVEERKKRQKELDERATTVPPPIRREARLEFDQRSAAVEKYATPLDEDSKEEPTDPEPATIGKHYRAINYDLWTYWRMVHGGGADSASRGSAAPSRHRRASSPGEQAVGGLFFDFGAVRTAHDVVAVTASTRCRAAAPPS